MIPAATFTIQSIPPAACISEAAVTTARMIATAAAGGAPGASRKTKTRIADTDAAPQADADAADAGAHDDAPEDDGELEEEHEIATLPSSPDADSASALVERPADGLLKSGLPVYSTIAARPAVSAVTMSSRPSEGSFGLLTTCSGRYGTWTKPASLAGELVVDHVEHLVHDVVADVGAGGVRHQPPGCRLPASPSPSP